jgi:uncharacterized protein (TIGR02145 family)
LLIMVLTNCSSDSEGDTPSVNPSSSSGSSSSSSEISSSSYGPCEGFVDGTTREHYGKDKPQFCDRRDGQRYVYVTTGEGATAQTWMAENLNYEIEGSVCYDDDDENCEKYGRLYNWATAMAGEESSTTNPSGVRGICPSGWHLPSSAEWVSLYSYIGSVAAKLKAASGWNDYDEQSGNGTDDYGFAALPGGRGISDDGLDIDFADLGDIGVWWNANEYIGYEDYAWHRSLRHNSETTYFGSSFKTYLISVRCVRDL